VIPEPQSPVIGTERLDLHNIAIDEPAAGRCGTIHLPSGRTCRERARHTDGCDFGARVMPRAVRRRLAAARAGTRVGAERPRGGVEGAAAAW
jgi:hypothetical protein